MIDSAQAIVAVYRYDPFGVLLAQTGTFEQPYGFSTKRYDARVGMVQYEFRRYFPDIARWDSRDPLGEAGGLNLYAFVGQNPVNWVDPWGLITCLYFIKHPLLLCYDPTKTFDSILIGPEGIHSGNAECKNVKSCSGEKDTGPIPPGEYRMSPNTTPKHEGWWSLQSTNWIPKISGVLYRLNLIRAGYNLHVGTFSNGCITIESGNPEAIKQFEKLSEMLNADLGNNILIVY